MPHVAQHPPRPRGDRAGAVVVDDDLHAGRDAEAREQGAQGRRIGKRVAALVGERRAAQVLVEVHVDGAGDVRREILAPALRDIGQVEARIDDDPPARAGQLMDGLCFDEGGER